MHMQSAIPAQPTFVINKPQLAELIEKTDARAGGAAHLDQCFLTVFAMTVSDLPSFPKWASNSSAKKLWGNDLRVSYLVWTIGSSRVPSAAC